MFGLAPLPRSLDAALRDVHDKKATVRVSAVKDLARHAAEPLAVAARAALVEALGVDVSAEVRGAAAIALADAGVESEAETLVRALDDTHLHVRQMALIALGEIGGTEADPRVLAAVERALEDEAPALRFQALIASSRLGAAFAEAALLRGARDADAEVRHVSFRLLEERATTGDMVVRPSDPVLRAAERGLRDDAPSVRLAAAVLLGRAGERSCTKVIVEGVEGGSAHLDPEDEQAAIVLAGELSLREATRGLERRAWGRFGVGQGRFAYEARIALARLGDERAKRTILGGLRAWSRDARTLAVVAAGRAHLVEARATIEAMSGDATRAEPSAVVEALAALEPPSRRVASDA
jgi:HEAT repeat protein